MRTNAFFRFSFFCLGATFGVALILLLLCKLSKLYVNNHIIISVVGFCLFYSFCMGVFGYFFASTKQLILVNEKYSIDSIEQTLNRIKYFRTSEYNGVIEFSTNKYTEWFYGKVLISTKDDKIQISAAKNILNKYFN